MTDQADEWATLDEVLGVETVAMPDEHIGTTMAFYGRCSTEDNQDPQTSRAWQLGNARKFVEPLGGQIVAEYFDIGQSRSVPWDRREQGRRLLLDLKNQGREWDAVVVGEGTRCWFGNQFSLVAPRFAAYDVQLWVPELGGRFEERNPSHKMLMSVLGGMSESERQHVQARVRAAMDAQVVNEGRYQGGRPPYGYVVVDGGRHPNPRKAAEGYRLRVLALDGPTVSVVRRIFTEYLDGRGDRAIALGLNQDAIPCPSSHRPEQNRHRKADGWQGSTVRAILDNPRYTGYAFFGRWTKQEILIDPDDVAAGHSVRFRRSAKQRVVRSRHPAHPPIVSVKEFTETQLIKKAKAAGGPRHRTTLDRTRTTGSRIYLLRGLIQCGICSRKMYAAPVRDGVYYRCLARNMAPGSAALAEHPRTLNLREDKVVAPLNTWIASLFAPENRARTLELLIGAQGDSVASARRRDAEERLRHAEAKLLRHRAAIEAGVDPAALVEAINAAQADRAAARAALESLANDPVLDLRHMDDLVDSLGDIAATIRHGEPSDQVNLYRAFGIRMRYEPHENLVLVQSEPRVVSARVRGGT